MEKILAKDNLSCAAECMIDQLCEEAHENAVSHGFYEAIDYVMNDVREAGLLTCRYNFILAQLAKAAGEIGECVSVIQNDEMEDLPEEMADVCIRLFDLAGYLEINLGKAIIAKMKKNKDRPYLHGKIC